MDGSSEVKSHYKQYHSLTKKCLVCTAPAPVHSHYGAVSCYPCRAFFRRGISRAYVCISGHNECMLNNITWRKCKKCRLKRCLDVGMKPELLDTNIKRKERERQTQENVADRREVFPDLEEGEVPFIPSLHSAENKNFRKESNLCDNQDQPQTFYIFDPRNKTYTPVIIVKNHENQKQDYSEKVNDTLVIRDGTSISSYERAFSERRVSVIKKNESNQAETPILVEKKSTHQCNQEQAECIDIEKMVDICFSEEINKKEDQASTEQRIKSKVLPFKKRQMCHEFEFLSTAIQNNQSLVAAFTFEEEFRLHELIVRRDYMVDEMTEYMLLKGPIIMKSALEQFSNSLNKKEKINQTESQIEFLMKCSHEFVSFKCQEVFDEFKDLDIRCFSYSVPATTGFLIGIDSCNKHLGLKETAKLTGHTGVTSWKLWEQYFSNIESGQGLEDYSMFSSPWAQSFEDEQFFTDATSSIGKLIGSDLKLCVLYLMLLMSSQPKDSPFEKNSKLKHLQLDLGLLLYRYLTTKLEKDEAAKLAHSLIGMLAILHECGDILMNRRIRMLPEEA